MANVASKAVRNVLYVPSVQKNLKCQLLDKRRHGNLLNCLLALMLYQPNGFVRLNPTYYNKTFAPVVQWSILICEPL